MKIVNITSDCLKTVEKELKKSLLTNSDNWIQITILFKNQLVKVKSFNTSIQFILSNGLKTSGYWDMSATEWKNQIVKHLS